MTKLVLLPGMDGTGDLFEPFLSALGARASVEVVRYPTQLSLGYPELVAFARKHIPTEEPFVLLGESFSGPVAIALAASHSPSLQGVILCGSFARNPRPLLGGAYSRLRWRPPVMPPIALLAALLIGKYSTKELRSAFAQAMTKVPALELHHRLQSVVDVDVSAELRAVSVPILDLRATQDRIVPSSASHYIAEIQPKLRIAEFDAPHMLLQAVPDEAADVTLGFLQEVGAY